MWLSIKHDNTIGKCINLGLTRYKLNALQLSKSQYWIAVRMAAFMDMCTKLQLQYLCTKLQLQYLCTKLHLQYLCTKLQLQYLCTKLQLQYLCIKLQ